MNQFMRLFTLLIIFTTTLSVLSCSSPGNTGAGNPATGKTITTVAGTGTPGSLGDGSSALSAQLNSPAGIFVDSTGIIYIADYSNNRLRSVDTSHVIHTFTGTVSPGTTAMASVRPPPSSTSPLLYGPIPATFTLPIHGIAAYG